MTRQSFLKLVGFIFILLFNANIYSEEVIDYDYFYSLDIPEGYEVQDYTKDGMSYLFKHQGLPISFALKIYDNQQNSNEILCSALNKLSGKYETDNFTWCQKEVSIATISELLGSKNFGWAISAPLKVKDSYIVLIIWTDVENAPQYQQFMISTINSLCIDDSYYNTPGIITSYTFPKAGKKTIKLSIGDCNFSSSIDCIDEEAGQFVVDLEFSVLSMYGKSPLWQKAWERYYRMVYRDNAGRLEQVSKDVQNELLKYLKKNKNGNLKLDYAQSILSWTQSFSYARGNEQSSDFNNLCSIISGKGSDCDSRSMLVAFLLKKAGIESILLISPEFSHALVACDINAPGQKFNLESINKDFLIGETTAKVTWGTMVKDQSDRSKWFPVILP